jgi:tripartite-type tricarboxylate transporter receptor subunit TctC
MRMFVSVSLAAAAFAVTTPASAFPDKPITINVCQAAGGGNDRNVQTLVPFAQKHLGQPIIVQYRPGAGGTLAMQEIKSATPDGHTLVLCDPGGAIFGPIVQNIGFKPGDVVPIARMSFVPWILTAHSKTPYKSPQDLVQDAKKRPGQIKASIADIASADHYTWLLFTKAAGLGPTGMRWVPYGGGAAKLRAMLAGEAEVDMLLESLIRDPLKQGTVRALAVASTERLSNLPDVPTFKELGFDVVDGLTVAIWAPAGTPPDRVATLREGLMKIRNDPEYQALYAKLGQDIKGFISGADYEAEWSKTWAEGQNLLKAVTQ